MTAPFDPEQHKHAMRAAWDKAAPGWNDSGARIRAWLRDATAAMLDMAAVASGARVLDVAAGAGEQTLAIAARVGAAGQVLATDLSPAILDLARANVARASFANVAFEVADGERLPVADASFDAAVCRLGLMFFPAPLAGLREMHRALRPGGGVCTVVFSTPEANPCVATVMATALAHAGLPPRDPYQPGGLMSLGKPGLIDEQFRAAGFHEVATTKLSAPFLLPSVGDYLAFIRTSASPVLQILARLDEAARAAAWAEMARKLARFETADGWAGPNELLLTAGRR